MVTETQRRNQSAAGFYRAVDRDLTYTVETDPRNHPFYQILTDFLDEWELCDKKCLEIGSAKGLFQNLVDDYTGVDVAERLAEYYHKNFLVVDGAHLPFPDASFDGIFTYATHEHIFELEVALEEIVRVLKPGGVCLFAPAWHTRTWFSRGYQVRAYAQLTWTQRIIKATIPLRDAPIIRWPAIIMRRLLRLCTFIITRGQPKLLKYKRLTANYERYWQSDSDACNSLDPFDVILWFRSRGLRSCGYESLLKALCVRTFALVLQKP